MSTGVRGRGRNIAIDLDPGRLKGKGEGSIDLIATGILIEIITTTIRVDVIEMESVIVTLIGIVARLTTADILHHRRQIMKDAITMKGAPAIIIVAIVTTESVTAIEAETKAAIALLL
mgnify:CR=1 FL=1